jgi:hypothetical protein
MKVLAAARHPGSAEAIGPVVEELRAQGHEVLLIGVDGDLPHTRGFGGSAAVLRAQGVAFVELYDSGYSGGVMDVPESYGLDLIRSFGPASILVGCSTWQREGRAAIEEVLIASGVRAGIRVVQVAESWGVWSPWTGFPTLWATLDQLSANILIDRGAPPGRIVITGHPGLDGYSGGRPRSRRTQQELGVRGDERLVVFFGQAAVPGAALEVPDALQWAVDSLRSGDRLAFSRHPRDRRDYSDIMARAGGLTVDTTLDSHELLAVADVSITQYSTMGLKSALLDIPTINILLDGDLSELRESCGGYPLSIVGGSQEVRSARELKLVLARDLSGDAAAVKAALNVDGNATERVVRLVVDS